MKTAAKTCLITSLVSCASVTAGLFVTGRSIGWGPFSSLYWPREHARVKAENPYVEYQNGIVFYGASNFRLWKEMKDDLAPYRVANCGFGGSTDARLTERACELLYPYHPRLVFLQTGSNDYVGLPGTQDEIVTQVFRTKTAMYDTFHENLPGAQLFVLAGILMPGRDLYTPIVQAINSRLREYCAGKPYITFIDSEALTYRNGEYVTEYFIKDGIHLTHEARLIWAKEFILPAIEASGYREQTT